MKGERVRQAAVRAGLIGLLVTATLGYGLLEKRVTVRIEGSVRPVKTFAMSVGDALSRAGIKVGPNDRVIPTLETSLRDGTQIKIYRAKPITIMLNGKPRSVIVTSLTVDEVLREIALRHSMHDYVGASRSSRVYRGMTIAIREAVGVTIVHDDQTERISTNAATVRQMLSELNITLGAKDKIRPSQSTYPTQGMTVKILRVGERKETQTSVIPPPVKTKRVANVEYGTRRVIQKGRPGLRVTRYLSTYVDGKRVKRKLLKTEVVRKPVAKVVGVGAGFPGCVCSRGSESGKASWYSASGLTAAHPSLPFGTHVRVTNLSNGKSVTVVIRDRGPFVHGRIIDLSGSAFKRIASLGAGVVHVRIRW